jgi:hypothetical protein
MKSVLKYTCALALGTGVTSTVSAQQPVIPSVPQPAQTIGLPAQSAKTPPIILNSTPAEVQPTRVLFQTPAPAPAQPPLIMSQQPPPFQVTPDTPAATNDPNFFSGNKPVQDLSSLFTGNFRETKYKWYGFVRLDGTYDFKPMGGTDSFIVSQIPVPQGDGQNFAMNPRYTRFGFDTETPIPSLDWTIKTRIEVDFFNGNNSGSFGSQPLRLRFAWADFGPFLVGQAASLFMDYDAFPNVLDYQGPNGMVLMRQPIIATHFPIGEKWKVSLGVEQPYSDIQWLENGTWVANPGSGVITTPGVARNVQDVPDFTSNIRYAGDNGHMQLAGIIRKLTYQPAAGNALDEMGYGASLTGTFHPWAAMTGTPRSGDCSTAMSKSRFLYQFAAGRGINRYLQDENGLALDATFDPNNGFRTIPSVGWFVAYEQWWGKHWASNFTYSETQCELTDTLPGNTYERGNYITGNLIWLPVERLGMGVEYLYGTRTNKDGQEGDNTRIQFAFQYKF